MHFYEQNETLFLNLFLQNYVWDTTYNINLELKTRDIGALFYNNTFYKEHLSVYQNRHGFYYFVNSLQQYLFYFFLIQTLCLAPIFLFTT